MITYFLELENIIGMPSIKLVMVLAMTCLIGCSIYTTSIDVYDILKSIV